MSSPLEEEHGRANPMKLYIITINIAHRIMLKAEQVVRRDTEGHRIELLHETYTHAGEPRLGFARTVYMAGERRHSQMWDITVMLDMRDGWETYVEARTLNAIREVLKHD